MKALLEDIDAVLRNDPATHSRLEALLCHSPLHALVLHRFAHWVCETLGWRLLARMIAAIAHFQTGVEIHPSALIGRRCFIDHGTGVVIGETARLGDDCVLFHNVTLGGTGKHHGKRHPTIGDGVLIGTGATLLGPITVGSHARIGAGAFVHMRDVPADCTVVGMPARIVRQGSERVQRELPRTEVSADSQPVPRPA